MLVLAIWMLSIPAQSLPSADAARHAVPITPSLRQHCVAIATASGQTVHRQSFFFYRGALIPAETGAGLLGVCVWSISLCMPVWICLSGLSRCVCRCGYVCVVCLAVCAGVDVPVYLVCLAVCTCVDMSVW